MGADQKKPPFKRTFIISAAYLTAKRASACLAMQQVLLVFLGAPFFCAAVRATRGAVGTRDQRLVKAGISLRYGEKKKGRKNKIKSRKTRET